MILFFTFIKLKTKNSRSRVYMGTKQKHGSKPQHLYIVRGNQFTLSITIYYEQYKKNGRVMADLDDTTAFPKILVSQLRLNT